MARKGGIARYSLDEIKERLARGLDRTDWARLDATGEAEIEAQIAADPDDVDLPLDWPAGVVVGLPEPKEKISLRLDADVLRWYRRQGRGWQTRINAVLRAYAETQRKGGG
jgi:uncharacterized protein (DUF4415 family)